jgi:selenide,water dikinase
MQSVGVNACTDITGFGLLGHLMEMMDGSGTSAILEADKVPVLPGTLELAASGIIPGGTRDNFNYTKPSVRYDDKLSNTKQLIMNDAQTSGGLLISVSAQKADSLVKLLHDRGLTSVEVIGAVHSRREPTISVE